MYSRFLILGLTKAPKAYNNLMLINDPLMMEHKQFLMSDAYNLHKI